MSTPKIALIGNCQVQTYEVLLPLMLGGQVDLAVFDVSLDGTRDEARQAAFIDRLADRDVVFTQRIDFGLINDERLREGGRARIIRIGNFYFRGLHPDSCYVGAFGGRLEIPSSVHSVIVIDAFRRGLSETAAARQFNPDAFERLGLAGAWQSSLDEMGRREADGFIDIPCRDLMETACRRYPAFHTMNHPAAPLLADYLSQILRFAGIAHSPVNAAAIEDPLTRHDCFPVLDLVAEQNRLPYRTTQHWRINHLGRSRYVAVDEYVAACYAAYREVAAERRLVHSPTDLVRRYRASDDLRFLVDADAVPPAPGSEADEGGELAAGAIHSASLRAMVRAAVREQTTPLHLAADELREYVHKVHSFVETADPKIERIAHHLPQLARREDLSALGAWPRRGRLGLGRLRRWLGR